MGTKTEQTKHPSKAKRKKIKAKSCSTPGITKNERCQASAIEKTVSRRNRSWNMKEYSNVLQKWSNKSNI